MIEKSKGWLKIVDKLKISYSCKKSDSNYYGDKYVGICILDLLLMMKINIILEND